jgi:pimeloyl-ACP methyl ester carboxylesterase
MANLVMIHGAGQDGRIWDRQVAAFGGAHRVLAVDLPGRRRRAGEAPLESLADSARDVVRQMDAAGMDRAVVTGHSMGGGVALLLALDHAARVAGLVLVASGARLRVHPDILDRARRRAEGEESDGGGGAVPTDWTLAPSASADVREFVKARASTAPAPTIYADFRATNAFDVMARIGDVSVPTLVVGSDEDRMTPVKYAQFLGQHIPGARVVILGKCGHYPHVEDERGFNEALTGFLSDLP